MNVRLANKVISKHENVVVLCTYNILFTNDICCGQIIESVQGMKRTPYYKQAFKRYLNEADKARKDYECTINSVIGSDRSEFFADCNDKYIDEVGKHVDMLYWAFKQVLDDERIEHSAELARFEVARTLCEVSCLQFEKRMDELKNRDILFNGFRMEYIKLGNVSRLMNMASDNLKLSKKVNMNTDNCALAFDVLVRKLSDAYSIVNAIK